MRETRNAHKTLVENPLGNNKLEDPEDVGKVTLVDLREIVFRTVFSGWALLVAVVKPLVLLPESLFWL
jgi:hypothetical protein